MLDIAPNFAGSVMGIINAVGNIMGFVAPLVNSNGLIWLISRGRDASRVPPQVVSAIVNNNQTIPQWRIVFLSAAAVNTVGNLVYVALGTSEEQPWNKPRDLQERLLSQH